jgi:hypothetical protein
MAEIESDDAGRELFALTDEQILGIEEAGAAEEEEGSFDSGLRKAHTSAQNDRRGVDEAGSGRTKPREERRQAEDGTARQRMTADGGAQRSSQKDAQEGAQTGVTVPLEAPRWLAERMKDPWHGEEARELWEGVQRAQREAGEYREVFANPADARALKELYPGGVVEAKAAAERARQLEDIDAAYFGGAGKAPAELSAGRAQLAQRLMEQDPVAFREMVMAGVKLLEGANAEKERSIGKNMGLSQDPASVARSLHSQPQREQLSGRDDTLVGEYRTFEKAANAELERSVGSAIERTMEQALPNLRRLAASHQNAGLGERLKASVREEIDSALKSDAQLGEQVARVLAGRRFDDAARKQVVRMIDARAQQLVPGAVRRVVNGWTQTAMAARRGEEKSVDVQAPASALQSEKKGARVAAVESRGRGNEKARAAAGRVNYGKLSDEEILEL